MSCPYCNMTLGWGPIREHIKPEKWYMPTQVNYRCAHCGKYVKRKQSAILFYMAIICFIAAWAIVTNYNDLEYFNLIVGGLVLTGLSTFITSILFVRYVKTEAPNH